MKKNKTLRKALFGNNRSHAMNATRRRFNLNLITIHIPNEKGILIKKRITAREYRTIKKNSNI